MTPKKPDDLTPEEKYGPVVFRYLSEEGSEGSADARANLDVAIGCLCRELSEDDGLLEQMRLLQEAEDEWAALRALLPAEEQFPLPPEDGP